MSGIEFTETILLWVADFLVLSGVAIITLAVYGLVRMPSLYLQLHAASKAVLLGIIPILLASSLFDSAMAARAVLITIFLILTTPVAAHAIARSEYLTLVTPDDPRQPASVLRPDRPQNGDPL